MKLKPGKCEYPLADCGRIEAVWLDEGEQERRGHLYSMTHIAPDEWLRLRGDLKEEPLRGRPIYVAWFGHDSTVRVYPAPDAAHDLRIRYWPHLREA